MSDDVVVKNARKLDRTVINRKFSAMKNEFASWQPALMELSQYINPTRGFFSEGQPNQGRKIDHKTVIDGHARRAVRTLASGMTSGLTSPSRPWFRLGIPDPELAGDDEVQQWLDEVQRRMLDVFSKSNIYSSLHTVYEEIGTFGTGCMILQEDDTEVVRARVYTMGEYYLINDENGRTSGFGRTFWHTVGQLVERFGLENCSDTVKQLHKSNETEKWVKVCHLIDENDKRIPGYLDRFNMPYRSCYWEEGAPVEKYLRVSGYEELPTLTPRWETTTTADVYGRGPGWDCLGDVKMLQKMQKQALLGLDKVVDPPIQVDSSVQGEANMLPGGVTRFSGQMANAGVKAAYEVRPDLVAIEAKIERVQEAISQAFYSNLFLMLINDDKGQMTATEVAERQSEKLQVLGPVLERLENELLNPMINRTYSIMLRRGLIPIPPKRLQGIDLNPQYISVLAQAQKMVGVTAMQQQIQITAGMATMDPQVIDNIDLDEATRASAEMLAIPAKVIRSREQVEQRRKKRDEAAAQAQQAQMAMAGAKAASDGASAVQKMATAPMGENSALEATLGAITGNQP